MTGELVRKLGYRFQDPALLQAALRHRSAGGRHNERLEFLGDAALNLVVGQAIFQRFPDASEGELSRLRAALVKGETLAVIARELSLGQALTLGSGELKSGGCRRESILADALEAVIGAVFLDGGFDACRDCVERLYGDRLDTPPGAGGLKDPKTRLQELLQSMRQPLPSYEVLAVYGEPHAQTFSVRCDVAGLDGAAYGAGSSRRQAEQAAAAQALERLGHD